MTVELLDNRAEDAEELVVAWMTPLRRAAVARVAGDPLPFTLVTHVAGTEDPDIELADPVVSVHTLCDKGNGYAAAKDEGRKTDRRMNLLLRYHDPIQLSDGRWAAIDYGEVVLQPSWEPFENTQILRKVGRYRIGLSYVRAP